LVFLLEWAITINMPLIDQEVFMSVLLQDGEILSPWLKDEIEMTEPVKIGEQGKDVRRIQEWLNLHGHGVAIDGEFGRVTEQSVKDFQITHELEVDGVVNEDTFRQLVAPLIRALSPLEFSDTNLSTLVRQYATAHLAQKPREIGGQNCGPWVRLYMEGHEGPQWAWCAGFISFILKQAAETLGMTLPIPGSFSCDSLAAQAKSAGIFINGAGIEDGTIGTAILSITSIFLVRRTDTDWTHTGFGFSYGPYAFETIEGNTNDEGSREGYEVCVRSRGYGSKDFILLP
jgi:hypothetical protein